MNTNNNPFLASPHYEDDDLGEGIELAPSDTSQDNSS